MSVLICLQILSGCNARKARPDGTGVRLYMAKESHRAHGGTILFESKEGQGSEFGFRLLTKTLYLRGFRRCTESRRCCFF